MTLPTGNGALHKFVPTIKLKSVHVKVNTIYFHKFYLNCQKIYSLQLSNVLASSLDRERTVDDGGNWFYTIFLNQKCDFSWDEIS